MKNLPLYTALLILCAGAVAADVSLSLALEVDESDSVITIAYDCGGDDTLSVTYVNAGANALAIMHVEQDNDRVFVNVISASGARYVSGPYVWWTKGDKATLENTLEEANVKECQAQSGVASE